MNKITMIGIMLFLIQHSCGEEIKKPHIGQKISSPRSVVSHPLGETFYVLNSDSNHKYKTGSILTLTSKGEKITSLETPRLGVDMTISSKALLVIFDKEAESKQNAKLILFDVSSPKEPKKIRDFDLSNDCTPISVSAREGYEHFTASCANGELYLGSINSKNLQDSSLKLVRKYPKYSRRAVYIDKSRELVFSFVTDIGKPQLKDSIYIDKHTSNDKKTGSNDIPDNIEKTPRLLEATTNNSSSYQFMLYDIKKARDEGFPYKKKFEEFREEEARWLYFDLSNGPAPDELESANNAYSKHYRTNFWAAKPDPIDPNTFYLSHRGQSTGEKSLQTSSIIKVNISGGDPRNSALHTENFFNITRVYGFKGEQSAHGTYFSDFEIVNLEGQNTAIANSFRGLVYFDKPSYSIGAATIGGPNIWSDNVNSNDSSESFFGIAYSNQGFLLTSLFYSDRLHVYGLKLGNDLELVKTIE